jgi:hypothetical protein
MPGTEAGAAGRRAFLRKAAIAGTGTFAAPMIITVDSADARALTSPPPEAPGSSTTPQGPETGAGRSAQPASRRQESTRPALPRTGADIDRLVAAGLAATAGGAALVLWSADAQAKSKTTPGSYGPADEEQAT